MRQRATVVADGFRAETDMVSEKRYIERSHPGAAMA